MFIGHKPSKPETLCRQSAVAVIQALTCSHPCAQERKNPGPEHRHPKPEDPAPPLRVTVNAVTPKPPALYCKADTHLFYGGF